jgi:low temperature requirement protein LtrA
LIYLHYFILFGISLFTVSLSFISEPDANPLFAASRLFGSIALFYIGLWLANSYNRVPVSNKVIVAFAATTIVGYLVNLCWLTFPGFVTTSTVVIICNAAILTHYNVTHQ